MPRLSFIGFGEAGIAFAGGGAARGYDRKTDDAATRGIKLADFSRAGVTACETTAQVVTDAEVLLSLVTADQALRVAETARPWLSPGAIWFDMNSVAPDTKRAAAWVIERAGARYVDVAVMAPVQPKRRQVPLLVSGQHAEDGAATLCAFGFDNVAVVAGGVGAASSIKMIRSVMVKGLEALTAECFLAAAAAGVRDAVAASLAAGWTDGDWAAKADYNLERMMTHGLRRAAEMEEVVKTLDALGTGSAMSRGTIVRQRAIGTSGVVATAGLGAKLAALLPIARGEGAVSTAEQDQAA